MGQDIFPLCFLHGSKFVFSFILLLLLYLFIFLNLEAALAHTLGHPLFLLRSAKQRMPTDAYRGSLHAELEDTLRMTCSETLNPKPYPACAGVMADLGVVKAFNMVFNVPALKEEEIRTVFVETRSFAAQEVPPRLLGFRVHGLGLRALECCPIAFALATIWRPGNRHFHWVLDSQATQWTPQTYNFPNESEQGMEEESCMLIDDGLLYDTDLIDLYLLLSYLRSEQWTGGHGGGQPAGAC